MSDKPTYLPFKMVVDATITKNTNFPGKKSFQTLLILATSLDETKRSKVMEYSSFLEAVNDGVTESVKDMLLVVFAQQVRPSFVKVAYVGIDVDIDVELSRISNIDNSFVFLAVADEVVLSDIEKGKKVAEWAGANNKIVSLIDSNVNALSANQTSLTRALKENNYSRAFAVYGKNDDEMLSMIGIMSFMATRNFDNPDTYYTAKFKNFTGVKAVSLTTTEYKGLTGFVPGQGLDKTVGNLGNVYAYVGDRAIFTEGNTASGELISTEHALLWLEYTIKYEIMNVFEKNDVVPYTNKGVAMIASALIKALDLAVKAGIIPKDEYKINTTDVLDVPESRRANHVAPPVTWSALLSGAIHYTAIDGEVSY